jgi:hypothetical protein
VGGYEEVKLGCPYERENRNNEKEEEGKELR